MKKIIIADDHAIVRDGIELMLAPIYGAENLATARNGAELLDALGKDEYELVVLDVQLPDITAFSLLPNILEKRPSQRVLVFSMYPDKTMAKIMFDLGAKGYLNKNSESQTILKAIDTVMKGEVYMSEQMMQHFTNRYLKKETEDNPMEALSPREVEVMMLLLQGNGILEISNALNLSSSTVATYKGRIFEKLSVKNLIELHNKCLALGLV